MFGLRKPAPVTPSAPPGAKERHARLEEYWTGGFRDIEGWVNPDLLRSLQLVDAFQQERGIGGGALEIGLHHGKFFIPLLLLRQPGEAGVGIDVFEDQAKNVDSSGLGSRAQVGVSERTSATATGGRYTVKDGELVLTPDHRPQSPDRYRVRVYDEWYQDRWKRVLALVSGGEPPLVVPYYRVE